MANITISEFFQRNGIEKIADQDAVLDLIDSRTPANLWAGVQLTVAQCALLGKVHGYAVEVPDGPQPDLAERFGR